MSEFNFEKSFIEHLVEMGYPKNKIVKNFGIIGANNVDIAIMDNDFITPIAFFEIKTGNVNDNRVFDSLKHVALNFKNVCDYYNLIIPCYCVLYDKFDDYKIIELTKYVDDKSLDRSLSIIINYSTLPSYDVLSNSILPKKLLNKTIEKQKHIDNFKPICWILLPLIIIIIGILDALNVYKLNTERIIILIVLIISILIPFFSEISFKDITFKRDKKK